MQGGGITTGTENTIVGSFAGDALTVAFYNTALGYASLSNDLKRHRKHGSWSWNATVAAVWSTNAYNTAVGYQAGNDVTSGVENTIIGALAGGDALTDADYNVAVGVSALSSDTKGGSSTAIGYQALLTQNSTSSADMYNTAVGRNAGLSVNHGGSQHLVG